MSDKYKAIFDELAKIRRNGENLYDAVVEKPKGRRPDSLNETELQELLAAESAESKAVEPNWFSPTEPNLELYTSWISKEEKDLTEKKLSKLPDAPVVAKTTEPWINSDGYWNLAVDASNVKYDPSPFSYRDTSGYPPTVYDSAYEVKFDITPEKYPGLYENLVDEPKKSINYLFDENVHLGAVKRHIDNTYSGHYSGKYQATSVIIDAGHGTGFNIGNIIKYAKRYGKKNGYNRDDLMKIIHYAIMQLYVQDLEGLGNSTSETN